VAEQFTGTPGVYVPVAESIRGFKEILEGKHDDLPESAFFMKGTIDDVVKGTKGESGDSGSDDSDDSDDSGSEDSGDSGESDRDAGSGESAASGNDDTKDGGEE
jgi:hypothetical protein